MDTTATPTVRTAPLAQADGFDLYSADGRRVAAFARFDEGTDTGFVRSNRSTRRIGGRQLWLDTVHAEAAAAGYPVN